MDASRSGGRRIARLAAVCLVLVVTAAAVATMVAYRLGRSAAPKSPGALIGTVKVDPGVSLHCVLPVTAYGQTAATISFPDGAIHSAATSPFTAGAKGGASYDPQLDRWLPVSAYQVSPDGKLYAFATSTVGVPGEPAAADVRVRDIATHKDTTVWRGTGSAGVIGWTSSTLYFVVNPPPTGAPAPVPNQSEVWASDEGRTPHRVGPNPPPVADSTAPRSTYGIGGMLGGGALWATGGTRPPAAQGKFTGGPDSVFRMDARTGVVSAWYTAPEGKSLGLVAIDAQGRPVIALSDLITVKPASPPAPMAPSGPPPPPSLAVVTAQGQTSPVSVIGTGVYPGGALADGHGVWVAAPGELWLLDTARLTLGRVATIGSEAFPAPTPIGPPVGIASKPVTAAPPPGVPPAPKGPYIQVAGACR